MKNKIYIVTGANGHLGKNIVKNLVSSSCEVRGLVLKGEKYEKMLGVKYYEGDVRNIESLRSLFSPKSEIYVIHTAAIVDISETPSPLLVDVNINGTKNIIKLCKEFNVKRLLYVSSVHAIPEQDNFSVINEISSFSSSSVVGGYAKTKAVATQAVLDAEKEGLDVVIVHPSGIIGPNDDANKNHLVQMIRDYISGKLPAVVNGGYDFVDVRDVTQGCISAIERGKKGECYILSNKHYNVSDLLNLSEKTRKTRKLPVLPIGIVEFIAPIIEFIAKLSKKRPLFTRYSLHTLKAKYYFSHEKATRDLGYKPRDMKETMKDTSKWIIKSANANC